MDQQSRLLRSQWAPLRGLPHLGGHVAPNCGRKRGKMILVVIMILGYTDPLVGLGFLMVALAAWMGDRS